MAPDAKLECSTSRAAPIADLVAGLEAFVLAGAASKAPSPTAPNTAPAEGREIAPVFLGLGVVWIASSVFGFTKTHSCLGAVEAQRACLDGLAEACRKLQESAPPPQQQSNP
jgi:hypothetical protein